MSRRKQEKPQPRKILVKGEVGIPDLVQDILTCGVCQKDFPLCDIVRFIQHKVQSCNKENACHPLFGCGDSDGEDAAPHPLLSPLRPTSIKKEDTSSTISSSSLKNNTALTKDKAISAKDLGFAEPCSYVCSTCTQSHTSAWALLQHVQNQHGLKIYIDSSNNVGSSEKDEMLSTSERTLSQDSITRAPLLEKQLGPVPIFPRPPSQELHLDLMGLSSTSSNHAISSSSPPPLLSSPQQKNTKSHHGTNNEPQLDFYSQRLRELAGATSPNGSASSSPLKLLQPSFKAIMSQKPTTPERPPQPLLPSVSQQTPPQLPQSSASSTTSENPPTSPRQPNPKSCEFCGKSFRFQSNLIVHRRSHTGEKPFKCHICNHACTQASKLKRHMKTHRRKKKKHSISDKPLALDTNTMNSEKNGDDSSSWTLNNRNKPQTNGDSEYVSDNENDELDDDDEEIDVEEDYVDDDDYEEEEIVDADAELDDSPHKLIVDQSQPESNSNDMVAEDLTKKRLNNGTSSIRSEKESKEEEEVDKKPVRHSLLSEVMEKIGLANIQQYNEAYKQALKESSTIFKQERHSDGSASNDDGNALERPARDGTRSAGQSPLNFGTGLLSAFDQSLGIKRLRMDDHWRDRDRENSLYAGLWIPAVSHPVTSTYKDLYSIDGHDRRKSIVNESALLNHNSSMSPGSSSPRPGPSSSSLCGSMGSIANSLLRPKDQRRNDTCEYCGKVFKNCSNLTVHRRSHTGEKPYKCELCSYACAQSSKLTRHMKTHGRLGKDVYRCRFCDMPFSVPSTLEKHMRKCVVSQSGGTLFLSERDSDSKEMTS